MMRQTLGRPLKYMKLYLEFLNLNIKTLLEYRADYIVSTLSAIIIQTCGLLFIWVIFKNMNTLNGWSFYEVTLLYGLMTTAKAFDDLIFGNMWGLGLGYISRGNLDKILVRPISPMFHLITDSIGFNGLGFLIIGIVIIVKSVCALNLVLSIQSMLLLILFIISGGLIFSALHTITATTAFWIIRAHPVMWAVYEAHDFGKYPLSIFGKSAKAIFTWLLPYGFVSFYPVSFLLHKDPSYFALLAPVIAAIAWLIAGSMWRLGLRSYNSTGS